MMPSIIKKRVTAYLRVLTGRQNAARGLTVYPDDTFLVSFPRSGNTWIRFLVGNLLSPDDPVSFATLESRIPEIYDVRDRRDVAVSYYEFQLKRKVISEDCSLEEFLPRFMDSEFEPTTGPWCDHVLS